MTYSFNLIDEPWVPCVAPDGQVEELGLHDTLANAHTYRELGGDSPLVTAALYRLLLAILHRVFGPEDRDAWRALWARGQWDADALADYFDHWRHRFDLLDTERPFYQWPDERVKPKWVGDIIHEMRANDAVFDHRNEVDGAWLMPAEAARYVVATQCYGFAGVKGKAMHFNDGTATRSISFFVQGQTLFHTLLLNMLRYPTRDDVIPHTSGDAPAWEMDNPYEPKRCMPLGYLDYLTWQNRKLMLGCIEAEGQVYINCVSMGPALQISGDVHSPQLAYTISDKRGWRALIWQESRALWRDSMALVLHEIAQPPRALDLLSSLVGTVDGLESTRMLPVTAFGMCTQRGRDKIHFYRREELPLPLAYLSDRELVQRLDAAIALAEDAGRGLWGALSSLAMELLFHRQQAKLSGPPKDERDALVASWGAERQYWAALELPFYDLIQDLPLDAQPARAAWAATVRRAAWRALEGVISGLGHQPAALKAAVIARGRLGAGLGKLLQAWPTVHHQEVTHVS